MNKQITQWLWCSLYLISALELWSGHGLTAGAFGKGLGIALLPLLPGLALLVWLDRLPPIGAQIWAQAFGWGSLVIPFVASYTHVMVRVVVEDQVSNSGLFGPGDDAALGSLAGSVLSAPMVEEALKGLLPFLLLWGRRPILGPWQSVMVGSLVAIGFGWFENAIHLGKAPSGSMMDAWNLRSSMAYLHVMFSLPMAFAIGMAALQTTLSRRIVCIGLGWLLSALLHGLWNWEVLLGGTEFSVAPGYLSIKNWSLAIVPVAWLAVFWQEYRSLQCWGAPVAKWYARSGMRKKSSEIRRALWVRWAGKIHPRSSPKRA